MFSSIVYAQTSSFADGATQAYGLQEVVTVGIAILLLIAILLTIVFVLWGGFLLVVSGGDEHKVSPAINMIRYSVVGLLVMIAIILITPALSKAVGFETVGEKIKPSVIFLTIRCVADRAFGKTDKSCFVIAQEIPSAYSTYTNSPTSGSGSLPILGGQKNNEGDGKKSPNGIGGWAQNL